MDKTGGHQWSISPHKGLRAEAHDVLAGKPQPVDRSGTPAQDRVADCIFDVGCETRINGIRRILQDIRSCRAQLAAFQQANCAQAPALLRIPVMSGNSDYQKQ